MKTGIIIQARMGASRLPGKVMMDLAGKPVLEHVVERCKSSNAGGIIVATSTNKENDVIVRFCEEKKYDFFRGFENDVLGRYYSAAREFEIDPIVRVTSDCPLISKEVIDGAIDKYFRGKFDYLSNVAQRSFPRGLDVEVFNYKSLEKADELAKEVAQREHVTPFIYNSPRMFKIGHYITEGFLRRPEYRLTLDTEDDLDLLKIIYERLYKNNNIDIREVIDFLDKNPEIAQMNMSSEVEHLRRTNSDLKQKFVKSPFKKKYGNS